MSSAATPPHSKLAFVQAPRDFLRWTLTMTIVNARFNHALPLGLAKEFVKSGDVMRQEILSRISTLRKILCDNFVYTSPFSGPIVEIHCGSLFIMVETSLLP